jgi:hypothetical protein
MHAIIYDYLYHDSIYLSNTTLRITASMQRTKAKVVKIRAFTHYKAKKNNSKICLHCLRIKSNYKKNLCYVHKVYTQVRSLLLISLSHIRLTGLKRFDLCWIASRRHATWHYSRHQQQSNTRDGDIRDVGNRFIYTAWR